MTTELTIVVPTYNEKDNIATLVKAIDKVLKESDWEIIFVDDDSPDETSSLVREMSQMDKRIRGIQRIRRRGLSSACIEGVLASSAPYICVMDADMQHDERLLPKMLELIKEDNLELVIGSRYAESGSTGSLAKYRVWVSQIATIASKIVLRYPVKDPMSGFFMMRRSLFENVMQNLSGKGFKILLDILVSSPKSTRYKELPYEMRHRVVGESKLGLMVTWDFFTLIADKLLGRIFPLRFISFIAVGLSGIFVHLFVLWLQHLILGSDFLLAQAVGTPTAMTSNYFLNNYFTFRDRKLSGKKLIRGLFSFYVACSFGAIINIAFSAWLFELSLPWWLAGALGAVVGAVWNYAFTSVFTWRTISNN